MDGVPKSRAEAVAIGASRYFTGLPCKHGHVAERQTANASCFGCMRVFDHARNAANPEKNRARVRAWRAANPEKHREWEAANREKRRAYKIALGATNLQKSRAP